MRKIKMKCPHCSHIIEEVHTNEGCEYSYSKEPPTSKEHGLSARLTCPKCGKDFYTFVTAKEDSG